MNGCSGLADFFGAETLSNSPRNRGILSVESVCEIVSVESSVDLSAIEVLF